MPVSGFCVLFLMVVIAISLSSFMITTRSSWFSESDLVSSRNDDKTTPIVVSTKLEKNVHTINSNEEVDMDDEVILDDYDPVDPSPDAASVNPGPIDHETPLIPFIPKPPPPRPPKPGQDDFD